MFEVTGLRKATLTFESFIAANWSEAKRYMEESACEFYNLTARRLRVSR
jgi:hypothetical protein